MYYRGIQRISNAFVIIVFFLIIIIIIIIIHWSTTVLLRCTNKLFKPPKGESHKSPLIKGTQQDIRPWYSHFKFLQKVHLRKQHPTRTRRPPITVHQ